MPAKSKFIITPSPPKKQNLLHIFCVSLFLTANWCGRDQPWFKKKKKKYADYSKWEVDTRIHQGKY